MIRKLLNNKLYLELNSLDMIMNLYPKMLLKNHLRWQV